MFCCNARFAFLDDYHWPTDPPPITGNVNDFLMVVDVDPHEFIDLSCSPQSSEIVDETSRIAGDADNRTVNVDDEGSGGIDLRACPKQDIWRPVVVK